MFPEGQFHTDKPATARTPLTALVWGNVSLRVYWRDLDGHVVSLSNSATWHGPPKIVDTVEPGYEFAVVEWKSGKSLRLYNQKFDGDIVETLSDDGGNTWRQNVVLAEGSK